MHIKPRFKKLVTFPILAFLLASFFLTPLFNLIPLSKAAPGDWWNIDWTYRKEVRINRNEIAGTLQNFPVLLDLTDSDLALKAQPDFDDIVFVDDFTNTKLNHEIESFDSSTGNLIVWVNVPYLSSTTDTILYMYYGNPAAENQQNPTAVWDTSQKLVLHLNETAGTHYDSTTNNNDGAPYGGVSQDTTGIIDGADTFDGINDYIEVPHSNTIPGFTTAFTANFWIKIDDLTRRQVILNKYNTAGNQRSWFIEYRLYGGQTRFPSFFASADGSTYREWYAVFTPVASEWYHIAVVWQSNIVPRFYINGQQVTTINTGSVSRLYNNIAAPLHIARCTYDATRYLEGALDEIRISNTAQSANWIQTSYNNQFDPSSFYTLGTEETYSEQAPTLSNESPQNGATGIYTNPELSVFAFDMNGDPLTVIFQTNATGTWQEIGRYTNVPSGTYNVIPSTMNQLGKQYYWKVCVTDGNSWTNETYHFVTTTTVLAAKWTRTVPRSTGGVLIADINGDGLEEVIQAGTGQVVALNPNDGSTVWATSISGAGDDMDTQMADLNKDGSLEIIVPLRNPGGLHVLFSDGSTFWRRTDLGGELWSSPVILDIDGSGYPTIFIASMSELNLGYDGTGGITSLSWDGQILHHTWVWHVCAGGMSIDDTNDDGEYEVYAGDRSIDYGDGGYGRGVQSFWARNLTQRWADPTMLCSSHIPILADVNGDGDRETIIGHHRGGVAVYDSTTGTVIRKSTGIGNNAPIHYQPTVYDIDGDGHLELLMADGTHTTTTNDIVIWDLVDWRVDWRTDVGACYYGPRVADLTGDGIMDVIACDLNGIKVFENHLGNNYALVASITGLYGWITYPVVQDMDGDGYLELVVSSTYGRAYAYDTPARAPAKRIRSEVQFYSERRLGVAEYVPPPGSRAPIISEHLPPDGATNVPVSLSELSFRLTDYQGDLMNYTVTTTPNIGVGSGLNVNNERYSITIGDLEYGATYQWHISVTDGTNWTNVTYTFTTQTTPPWWNTDWQYRKQLAIDPTKVTEDQINFSVVIDLTDDTLPIKAQTDGDDFVFTDENNVKLNHEIESYDYTTGHLIAWVNVPYVSSTTQTILFMYYGNPHAPNQENPPAAWDTSHKLVLHLSETHECRMWGMIADSLPHDVVLDHLINMPYSLEALSTSNRDGWGIVYYTGTDPTVLRGPQPAYLDPNYDIAVNQMADSGATIGVAHVRARSSGAIPVWGNPHPFMRYKNGKWWAFSHNGNLNKATLKSLIGTDYLAANPPTVGTDWDDPDVVDSDLYGLYVLKCIEANNWNATIGIAQAIADITKLDSGAANFILTDGQTLWGFRKGNTLEYYYTAGYSAIASQHPTSTTSGWISLSDYNLITLKRNAAPSIVSDIRQLYPLLVDSDLSNSVDSTDLRTNSASQDWYESRNDLQTILFLDTSNIGGNTGKKAGFTANSADNAYLTQEFSSAQTSTFSVQWDIYVDSILDISGDPDRSGIMLIGDDSGGTNGPNSADGERFVFLAFYKDGGATSGTADLVWMDTFSVFTSIASVNLDQWYTIKVVLNLAADTYDVYLDGVFIATVPACTAKTSVTHVSFAQWNDGAGAFYVDNVFSPTANRYRLTINIEGNGSVDVDPAESSYASGSKVELTAIPDSGWMFTEWKGDASGNDNPLTITMDSHMTIIANFTEMLLVDSEFNDSSNSDSLRTNAAGQDWYESRGDVPTLLFLDETDVGGNAGKKAGFTASSSGNAYLSQEFSSAQAATFSVQWDIYVDSILDIPAANPDRTGWMMIGDDSGGTNGPNSAGAERFVLMAFYKDGGGTTGTMDLMARERGAGWTAFTTIASGLYLKQWYTIKVVCNLDTDTYDIYLDGEYKATVTSYNAKTSVTHISFAQWNDGAGAFYVDNVFAPAINRYKLTVNAIGNGFVTVDPGESTYAAGTEVTLTAIADLGFAFAGWSGDLIDHVNPVTITMDSDKVVNATFIEPQYSLTISIVGSGSVSKDPDKSTYTYGESVILTASPSGGWTFLYWSGDLIGTENPTTIIIDGDKTVTSRFIQEGTCIDSTLNGNDGTLYGGTTQGALGQIGGAYEFDGVNDYIEIPHSGALTGYTEAFTASFWLRLDDVNRRQAILNKYDTAGNQRGWYIEFQNHASYGRVLGFFASSNGATYGQWYASFNPTLGAWYYITVIWEANEVPRFYVDGDQVSTIGTSAISSIYNNVAAPLHIGRCTYNPDRYLKGALDEIRISNPTRSASYILTCYNNQKDPSIFHTIGEEETLPTQPLVSDPYPTNGETNIPITLTELSFNITDYQGDLMDYYVSTYPDIGGDSATGVSDGRYSVAVSGLQHQIMYTWHVNVTDGTNWTNRTFTFTTLGALLVDSELDDSADSDDLRANSPEQDWYESRAGWSGGVPTLLYLDETDVGGNAGKKAGFTASSTGNAYLSQEFSFTQAGTFSVQWDIYVDSILDISGNPDRSGIMLIGSDLDSQKGPSSTDSERFVFMAFYKDGGATSGPVDLVAMSSFSSFTTVASGLNLKEWHTIKVTVNVTAGNYKIYVNGIYKTTMNACTQLLSVTHASFAQWNDGAGAFYIDNVYASTEEKCTLTVNVVGNGLVQKDPDLATYVQGTEVNLTAIADSGWTFTGWSGDLTGIENPTAIVMDSNKNITATFIEGVNLPPTVSSPEPTDGAMGVPISTSQLNFTISDLDGDPMDYYLSTSPSIGSDTQTGMLDGTYSLSVANLAYETTYQWWINVTDGTHWTNASYTFTTEPLLLVDSEFNDSASSEELYTNGAGQDWYDSRDQAPTLVFLDKTDVGGNTGKKAGFIESTDGNIYLTQEFSTPQTGVFSVQWDIYVDSIYNLATGTDATGFMMIGDDSNPSYPGPNYPTAERFVYMAFYKNGGGTSGTMELFCRQRGTDTRTTIATLNLDQWYTIRVIVNVPAGTYDVYVDGTYMGTYTSRNAKTSVTHISFAQWNDGAGAFYIDNVFSPAVERFKLTVSIDGDGVVAVDPGESSYPESAVVSLTPTAGAGYVFNHWELDGLPAGSDVPYLVTMDADHTVVAFFTSLPNVPPEIDDWYPVGDPSILEGESQLFNVTYHDDDADILTVQWLLNGSYSGSSDEYILTTDYDDSGIYNVTVAISDDEYTTTRTWWLTVVDVGPTLLMPFDSDESPDAVDESGYGNNGTIVNTPEWTSDYGGCYFFNAADKDYIVIPDDVSLDGGGSWTEITIEFWIKPTIDNKAVRLIEKRSAGSSYQIGFQTSPSPGVTGNQLYWDIWTSTSYKEIVAPFGLETGKWSHVVCWYKDGVGMAIYVNGTLATSTAHTGTINDSTCPINVGRRGDDTSYFTGFLDDLRLYIKALPEPMIQQHYDNTKDSYVEVNHSPEINSYYPIGDPSILEGESQEFNITCSDPDGDDLLIQWYLDSAPVGTTNSTSYTFGSSSAGTYNITVIVSDGSAQISQQWMLTVNAGNAPPEVSNPEPSDLATDVSVSTSMLNFTISDANGDSMDYYVSTNPDIGSDIQTGKLDGVYYLSVSGLEYETEYTWWVNVTDGTDWTNMTFTFTTEPLLLVDSEFNDSDDSADLRANNATAQDWYESRNQTGYQTLVFLDESDIGGDTGKKAGFTASSSGNAYLSQEFSSAQAGTFSVQWDIYVDSILDISGNPDRAGWMLIGDDTTAGNGPNAYNDERFVYMAFFKDGGGSTGTMSLVARDRDDGWTAFTTIATGLNLKQWYTIRVVCNLMADTYDVYVDGEFKATVTSRRIKDSVTHISFAQWNDGAGAFYVDNVFSPSGQASVPLFSADSVLTSPSGDYRWMDVADQTYSSEYINSYNYSQASVTVIYNRVGNTLTGKLIASNLKPNFAYQLKLVGIPGTASNELIGLTGRWWQEIWNGTAWTDGWNLNDKGDGSSPNPNDLTYFDRRYIENSTSPTGYHYRYTGYLVFCYFITDSNGNAEVYFETGYSYHVLWKTSQRVHTSDDGPLKTVTFDPDPSEAAYDVDYANSTITIFGEWERLPMGGVHLPAGEYDCQIVLTEESFHGVGPLEGNWASAMSANISFTITA